MARSIGSYATGAMTKIGDFVHKAVYGNTVDYKRPPEQSMGMNAHPNSNQVNPQFKGMKVLGGRGWGP